MSPEQRAQYTLQARKWKQTNRDKWNAYQKERYLEEVGELSRRVRLTEDERKEYRRNKSAIRCTRAKQARFFDELTDFVAKEAHALRTLRNKHTGFEWHVDHIIPLKGVDVCGLHIWSNLAVIPKLDNLRKGNKYSLHDKWAPQLQEGIRPVPQPSEATTQPIPENSVTETGQ